MTSMPDLRLLLPNRADNVSLVRQVLTGVADGVQLEQPVLNDVKTAVSEACNNVVLHAYEGGEGPLELDVRIEPGELRVSVRDLGGGIQPTAVVPDAGVQGVGLSLITALSDSVQFLGSVGEGTEVRMVFAAPVDREPIPDEYEDTVTTPEPPPGDTVASVCEGPLSGPVLSALVGGMAARAGLSVEQLNEAQLATDAIAAHAYDLAVGRHVHVGLQASDGALELWIGTLVEDGGGRLLQASTLPGLGQKPLLERVADEVEVETTEGGERVRLRFAA